MVYLLHGEETELLFAVAYMLASRSVKDEAYAV